MQRDSEVFPAWFWSQVRRRDANECWLWVGQGRRRNQGGYGVVNTYGGYRLPQQHQLAHRVAYELTCGAIPDGRCVLHRCDNPPCCNPAHLFVGTRGDNIRDARDKGRALVGEKNYRTGLTEAQVLEIRRLYVLGSGGELGRRFGVTPGAIRLIVKRKNWRHLP